MNAPTGLWRPQWEVVESLRHLLGSGSINIFSPVGGGKGTQCPPLAEALGAVFLDGGEIFRHWKHSLSAEDRAAMEEGLLIPSGSFLDAIKGHIAGVAAGKPLVLGSVGRVDGEQDPIMEMLAKYGHPLAVAVHLDVPREAALLRCKRRYESSPPGERREDESTDEKRLRRWHEYQTKTIPVIQDLEARGLLIRIDGDQPKDRVALELWNAIHGRLLSMAASGQQQ